MLLWWVLWVGFWLGLVCALFAPSPSSLFEDLLGALAQLPTAGWLRLLVWVLGALGFVGLGPWLLELSLSSLTAYLLWRSGLIADRLIARFCQPFTHFVCSFFVECDLAGCLVLVLLVLVWLGCLRSLWLFPAPC